MPQEDLEYLEVLFEDLDIDRPTSEQLFEMYGYFLNDFVNNPLIINGKQIIVNNARSSHPLFRGKMETFVHVITRKSGYTNKRQYDRDRANRIHWIRPILENASLPDVLFFEKENDERVNQHFYWCPRLEFVIILREMSPDLLLLTAFCVDNDNKKNFKKWYTEYLGHKKTPLRK